MKVWQPPSVSCFKLNLDVTYFKDSSGLGFIIGDYAGQVLIIASKWILVLKNSLEGETIAIVLGLELSSEASFLNLEVEKDNL